MDSTTSLYIVLALVGIFFIFCVIFSAKTWKILHLLMSVFVLFGAVGFLVLTTATLKTHNSWRTIYNDTQAQLEDVHHENALMQDGIYRLASGEVERTENSIQERTLDLRRQMLDRGRVWRNCVPGNFDGNSVVVSTAQWGDGGCTGSLGAAGAELEPVADGEGEARAHGIEPQDIVYAFVETPIGQFKPDHLNSLLAGSPTNMAGLAGKRDLCTVPTVFLGEFAVSAVAETSVTLSPTRPLTQDQDQDAKAQGRTWVLYDVMPIDLHEVFLGLNEEQLKFLFAEDAVSEYARDGKPGDRRNDPPERLWVEVKFKQDYSDIEVDAGGEFPLFPLTDFDPLGRALPAWLRHSLAVDEPGKVEFTIGDSARFDPETAKDLIDRGICEEVKQVYVRELRDYVYLFAEMKRLFAVLDDKAGVLRRDIATLSEGGDAAITLAKQFVTYRQQEVAELKEDLQQFTYERDELGKYRDQVEKQRKDARESIKKLYRANNYLATQLVAIHNKLEKQIRQRTQEAIDASQASSAP